MRSGIVATGLERRWGTAAKLSRSVTLFGAFVRCGGVARTIRTSMRGVAGAMAISGTASGAVAQRSLQHACCGADVQQNASGSNIIRTAAPIAVILWLTTGNVNPSQP